MNKKKSSGAAKKIDHGFPGEHPMDMQIQGYRKFRNQLIHWEKIITEKICCAFFWATARG
jgi:hypothetical protein